jgi:uncharacterized protein YeaO (DUF488 family)
MAIRVVRLGSPRRRGEGLRLGTVRRPPRGVRKADHARLDYYDVWLPELAPSTPLVNYALSEPLYPQAVELLCAPLPERDAQAARATPAQDFGRAVTAGELLGGVLLRG